MKRKKISLILCIGMMLSMLTTIILPASAEIYSGNCGDNVVWRLDNGVLMISGSGAMQNYGYLDEYCAPWHHYSSSIVTLVITDGVTHIGDYAFRDCTNLADITVSDDVTNIDRDTFYDTAYYNDVSNWENDVLYIGTRLVAAKESISGTCTIKDGTSVIGNYAFRGCTSLASVVIGNSVTSIGERAFSDCTSLASIVIPDSVVSIGEAAFQDCSSLSAVKLPEGLTEIVSTDYESGVFSNCISLTTITIPESVSHIGDYAFVGCSSLATITIPNGVTSIGSCSFLHTAYYNDDANWKDGALYIGKHLIEIARSFCGNLLVLENTLSIGADAFSHCYDITGIVIPSSVMGIGKGAFYECTALTNVYYRGTLEQAAKIVIGDWNEDLRNATWHYNSNKLDAATIFSDVKKKDWYYKAVDYAVNNNLFSGTSETTFSPNDQMTRAMFVTVLGRLHGVKVNNKVTTVFADVKKNQYYTGYVKWANENNIVSGTSATTFGPNENITREQICAMMVRYCNYADIQLEKVNAAITF
ncbi:MAG: leucine-rich repeat protein, partial [Clostridia bacterium]|nr:leucine-rich repeat protein [Clostridia bacterium]